ncbi:MULTISPECIES: hypothetical protein [Rhodobacterales]|jgi:hypothetical protein|uniref:Uncharacterized protein n=1 Tax=Marivita cryptomonadis TaxID=505252 RepID=A0A9Q2S781_9RHOB|nr:MULTISPECIES: hypothetical protein [Rhodobacterales]MBM1222787.1 hypothetical protein [Ponticoccus sp. SC6-9]MBM1227295.1 hypothetical protein [Ponticoccus sp. SC6-15]MBM1231713.1 hypothetical protein [Ponticoccus sp. SC6-38]MBM1236286.1 hypothetical protein [Ponticoccus sp. SC6-45]MBM1240736.1 hypothetical protein [Ponticoccus sp. SC6-49]MBM1245271.1 hypothetical protein [Ponticoccus sp. SC2-64]MBM1249759.1 hypothetical protein [Ponticoccus sp. SC6-42]MBM1254229.1 hypothetical protein [
MKTFENEVLTFDPLSAKSMKSMPEKLREWGQAGFKVVSVVHASAEGRAGSNIHVFLTRENASGEKEDAA